MEFRRHAALAALIAGAVLTACGDAPDAITMPFADGPRFHVVPIANPEVELLALCKVGPAGTYQFQANATDNILFNTATGNWDLASATYTVTVGAGSTINVGGANVGGACFEFTTGTGTHNHIARASGTSIEDVTVVETGIPAGQQFVKVDKYQKTGGNGGPVVLTSSNVNTVTAQVGGTGGGPLTLVGANVVFFNQNTPVYNGNSINVQTVRVWPTLAGGKVSSFTGSFQVIAFDQPVTVVAFSFKLSKNGEQPFWTGQCTTVPGLPLNVLKSSTADILISACNVPPDLTDPTFGKGDDVKLEVVATLATGRVFRNTGFYKIP